MPVVVLILMLMISCKLHLCIKKIMRFTWWCSYPYNTSSMASFAGYFIYNNFRFFVNFKLWNPPWGLSWPRKEQQQRQKWLLWVSISAQYPAEKIINIWEWGGINKHIPKRVGNLILRIQALSKVSVDLRIIMCIQFWEFN